MNRIDELARAMAQRRSRRETLRLVGGSLAGALLAAVGLTDRTRAQFDGANCDVLRDHCIADAPECVRSDGWVNGGCLFSSHAPRCLAYHRACAPNCGKEQDACRACTADEICLPIGNPGNRLYCRCEAV